MISKFSKNFDPWPAFRGAKHRSGCYDAKAGNFYTTEGMKWIWHRLLAASHGTIETPPVPEHQHPHRMLGPVVPKISIRGAQHTTSWSLKRKQFTTVFRSNFNKFSPAIFWSLLVNCRKVELADKFATKALAHPHFERWFPLCEGRAGARRQGDNYKEYTARIDRLNNTLLFYFRRRLNGNPEKRYGERNRQFWDT